MLDEAIELQNNAVKKLISLIPFKDEIVFKAPTGSGKTHMMADLMNQVLKEDKDVIFLVSTLSKGNLAEQNCEKFLEYSANNEFPFLNPYPTPISSDEESEGRLSIPEGYNVYILPTDKFKSDGNLKKYGILLNFLNKETMLKPFGKENKIYLIKDECHRKTSNLDEISMFFSKIFDFSATPNLSRGQLPDVEIKEEDAVRVKLIKEVEFFGEDDDNETNLNNALDKLKELKSKYVKEFDIKPCLIIQISDAEKAKEEIENIKALLNKRKLQWMFIFNPDSSSKCETNHIIGSKHLNINLWKKEAKSNQSTIDVIIFKQVITEGWDIPRACILCQIRKTQSEQLKEQVLGRIRRNPVLLKYDKMNSTQQELATKAFVYGRKPKENSSMHSVKLFGKAHNNEIASEIKLKTTVLKNIKKNPHINVENIINNAKPKVTNKSIFELYASYKNSSNEVKALCRNYIKKSQDWIKFVENINEISKQTMKWKTDYLNSMEILKDETGKEIEVSFPLISYYTENSEFKNISIENWIWQRTDGKNKFSFDSEAELKWAKILLDFAKENSLNIPSIKSIPIKNLAKTEYKYLLGKNYLHNSQIKYEYYLNGLHSSYPDFIMKDIYNRIHIFETKCINKSAEININEIDYEEKIFALKECYKFASKLTGYYFYIPVLDGEKWQIHMCYNGECKQIGLEQFKEFVTQK